jgi:hypothetical protein
MFYFVQNLILIIKKTKKMTFDDVWTKIHDAARMNRLLYTETYSHERSNWKDMILNKERLLMKKISQRVQRFWERILRKKNRKITFVVLFFSMMLSSIEKKKNQKAIFVDFFLDRASSSSSLSSSFINSESRFVTQSSRSLSSSTFRNIAIMFDALMKNVVSFSKIRLTKKYLTELHHEILSSISFTSKWSSNALRSRRRIKKMISIASKKRVKSSKNSCECAMSTRWREVLAQINRIRSIRSVEHLLKKLYYLERQICERHINELERLYDLLSMKNLSEMKNILWRLLKYSKTTKIFKIENVDLYESFENDD